MRYRPIYIDYASREATAYHLGACLYPAADKITSAKRLFPKQPCACIYIYTIMSAFWRTPLCKSISSSVEIISSFFTAHTRQRESGWNKKVYWRLHSVIRNRFLESLSFSESACMRSPLFASGPLEKSDELCTPAVSIFSTELSVPSKGNDATLKY